MGSAHNQEQKHRHHHLICRKCGKVTSFRDDLTERPEKETPILPVDHEVKLYGYCIACRKDRCPKDAEKLSGRGKI